MIGKYGVLARVLRHASRHPYLGHYPFTRLTLSQNRLCSTHEKTILEVDSSMVYKRYDLREHVLSRPDMYIGPKMPPSDQSAFLWNGEKFVKSSVKYSPALIKIFDEILVNAADNKQRSRDMTMIKVTLDKESGKVTVWNDGLGLPIREHSVEKVPIPTFVFGYPMVSSHHDDSRTRIVGGRNGYGAKVCNILSSEFTVRTGSSIDNKLLEQTWTCNMKNRSDPIISEYNGDDFTEISFIPDFKWFGVDGWNSDSEALIHRRVLDIAATLKRVQVYYQGELVKTNSFCAFAKQFLPDDAVIVHLHPNKRWDIVVAPSFDSTFGQVSFVNNVSTSRGGQHVEYVVSQIVNAIRSKLEQLGKKGTRSSMIKSHLNIFVNAVIDNPTFQSQTKEELTTEIEQFGSTCKINETAIQEWAHNCGILDELIANSDNTRKAKRVLKQALEELNRLDDANWAGSRRSDSCTLIITEGESAKALALAGREVTGRDTFGVLPIRGRLLNVKDVDDEKVFSNNEISSLCVALGLDRSLKYENEAERKTLRYGRLMLFADQDEDGAHIKGLIINFLHAYWPALLQHEFLCSFATPLLKAKKGSAEMSFFARKDFERWFSEVPDQQKWNIKYYKGLGTSTSNEAREYFANLKNHLISFKWNDGDKDKIEMIFNKSRADDRKKWLEEKSLALNSELESKPPMDISFGDFVDSELYEYSAINLKRSIPSVIDGLKPSQRKILYTCLQQQKEWKVSQLSGAVAHLQAYYHGESSLESAIVRMAQDFVGANNLPLIMPIGQFGTRAEGGSDAASSRYIHTQLNPLTRFLFPADDDANLELVKEDNKTAEPKYLCPIIPTVLLNGCEGIATGWSTKVLPHHPLDIVENVFRLLDGQPVTPMKPWFRGFRGATEVTNDGRVAVRGLVAIAKQNGIANIRITELPVGVWTYAYKAKVLKDLEKKNLIKHLFEYHTESKVCFEFDTPSSSMFEVLRLLRLTTHFSTNNMVLFNQQEKIHHFRTQDEIFAAHHETRGELYRKRINRSINILEKRSKFLHNQERFIECVINRSLNINDSDIMRVLVERGFENDPFSNKAIPDYEYLFKIPLGKLRQEELERLRLEAHETEERLCSIKSATVNDIWKNDLLAFIKELEKRPEFRR